MNAKKTIITLGSSLLLASTLLASPAQGCNQKQNYKQGKSCYNSNQNNMKCGQQKMKYSKHNKKGRHHNKLIGMMMHLDLSDDQRAKIKSIFQNNMKNKQNISSAFTDTSFNKAEFVKMHKQRQENKIERKAELIESVYKVLTANQKKEFKLMLDKKAQRKHKKMK
jgi:periplasmic protein CpxP/Spy